MRSSRSALGLNSSPYCSVGQTGPGQEIRPLAPMRHARNSLPPRACGNIYLSSVRNGCDLVYRTPPVAPQNSVQDGPVVAGTRTSPAPTGAWAGGGFGPLFQILLISQESRMVCLPPPELESGYGADVQTGGTLGKFYNALFRDLPWLQEDLLKPPSCGGCHCNHAVMLSIILPAPSRPGFCQPG